jgi:hypothetical protein
VNSGMSGCPNIMPSASTSESCGNVRYARRRQTGKSGKRYDFSSPVKRPHSRILLGTESPQIDVDQPREH